MVQSDSHRRRDQPAVLCPPLFPPRVDSSALIGTRTSGGGDGRARAEVLQPVNPPREVGRRIDSTDILPTPAPR